MKAWLSSLGAVAALVSTSFGQVGKRYDKLLNFEDVLGSAFTAPAVKEIPKTREAMVKAVAPIKA